MKRIKADSDRMIARQVEKDICRQKSFCLHKAPGLGKGMTLVSEGIFRLCKIDLFFKDHVIPKIVAIFETEDETQIDELPNNVAVGRMYYTSYGMINITRYEDYTVVSLRFENNEMNDERVIYKTEKVNPTSSMTTHDIIGLIGVLGMYECVLDDPTRFEAGELPVPWVTWDEGGDTYTCVLRTYMPYDYSIYCERNGKEINWELVKESFERMDVILSHRFNEEQEKELEQDYKWMLDHYGYYLPDL